MTTVTVLPTTEEVKISEILDDPSWPTDSEKVDAFRGSIQRGMPLGTVILRRVWHDDASWHYEIIDGFHRTRALIAEEHSRLLAHVVEWDERTADIERAHASLDKPDNILAERAVQTIRQLFVKDMAAALDGASLLERRLDDTEETVQITRRTITLDDAPADALMAVIEHGFARRWLTVYHSLQRDRQWWNETKTIEDMDDWMQRLDTWMGSVQAIFQRPRTWLIGVLGLGEFENGGKLRRLDENAVMRSLIIPDPDIRAAFLARLRQEPRMREYQSMSRILEFLGIMRGAFPRRSKQEMLRLLASHSLTQLYTLYHQTLAANQQRRVAEKFGHSANLNAADGSATSQPVFAVGSIEFTHKSSASAPWLKDSSLGETEAMQFGRQLKELCAKYNRYKDHPLFAHWRPVFDIASTDNDDDLTPQAENKRPNPPINVM